ncbi:YjcG family protein [Salipaludibacillus sp. CF4.18]|uniref:YjcG family protein n=1 Tax=Salipaludibacillus sp. CF4.18 TaxID=3373081 RepID=UPI003EE679EC
MKYGIAVFPSKDLQDIANSYRKRYDPKYAKVPPHLTLKAAFELNEDEEDDMIKQLREIASTSNPFTLKIGKYSTFHPVTNTIYMKVTENEDLFALHAKLNEGDLTIDVEHPYVPHITIGQEMNYDELSDVYGRLKLETIHHEETVDRFSLMYQLENGAWSVHETFVLGKSQ